MTEVVALVGVIGAGKDHRADQFVSEGYARVDFKDEMLDMVSDLCGYDVRTDYSWFKHAIVGIKRPPDRFQEGFATQTLNALVHSNPELMTGRRLLQRFGTNLMRKRDPEAWVKAWGRRAIRFLESGRSVVAGDCRFVNEYDGIASLWPSRRFVFSDYRSSRYDPKSGHESEAMAQFFAAYGLKDGQEIEERLFRDAEKSLAKTAPRVI